MLCFDSTSAPVNIKTLENPSRRTFVLILKMFPPPDNSMKNIQAPIDMLGSAAGPDKLRSI